MPRYNIASIFAPLRQIRVSNTARSSGWQTQPITLSPYTSSVEPLRHPINIESNSASAGASGRENRYRFLITLMPASISHRRDCAELRYKVSDSVTDHIALAQRTISTHMPRY